MNWREQLEQAERQHRETERYFRVLDRVLGLALVVFLCCFSAALAAVVCRLAGWTP